MLKDQYYSKKASEIKCAAEARQVEKEFQLAKNFRMHQSSSKIHIFKEKLTEHFEKHFFRKGTGTPTRVGKPL